MEFQISIPAINGGVREFKLTDGSVLFVLGANGSGKSGLLQRIKKYHIDDTCWISAHRQNWLESDSVELSPQQKRESEKIIRAMDSQPAARWKDHRASQRVAIAVYELVESENANARTIANAARSEDWELVEKLKQTDPPIKTINDLLKASNLPLVISIDRDEEVVASKQGSLPYGIGKLSDGERNALLIGAKIVTAKPGTLFLIDEPERHLHRSIISPLLTHLFKKRRDCAFIVSTHEVLLPLDNPDSQTLLVRSCTMNGEEIKEWETDLVPKITESDEDLRADILGARKKILFVEGTAKSLDQPLYTLIFPGVSVIAKSSFRDVEHAVSGLRSSGGHHWLSAFGIVDSDGRSEEELNALQVRGIYAVPAYSIEGIYYHPEIQRRVSMRHAKITGGNSDKNLNNAKQAVLTALNNDAERMSARLAEKVIRSKILRQIPGKSDLKARKPLEIKIDIAAEIDSERSRFDVAINNNDLEALINRYPIRETQALSKIAQYLGFQDTDQYESAVRRLLIDDEQTTAFVRGLFRDLWEMIQA